MKPNILLVVIDDLPRDVLQSMTFTKAEVRDKGTIFNNGTITTPLCGPSRLTILSGKVAHNHGMWANTGPNGGWRKQEPLEPNLLPVALKAAGYRTGLFGKYANQWSKLSWAQNRQPPPGWDRFRAIDPNDGGDGAYYNYKLVGTGTDQHFGDAEGDYSTDVIANRAATFIQATDESVPFFCYFSPYGTHGNFTPAPRHVDTYPRPATEDLNPAVNSDNNHRATWLRGLPPVDIEKIKDIYKSQQETVMSVDEGIETIFGAIGSSRLANTLVLVTGDNGLQRGEQRLMGKNIGYPGSTNVPMLARRDGHIDANSKSAAVVTNADFTRTIVDAAGATMSGLDGVPLGTRSDGTLLEGMVGEPDNHPGFIGWRSKNWLYLNYGIGQGDELYNINLDPNAIEVVNTVYPGKVQELRDKAIAACNPLPPDFVL